MSNKTLEGMAREHGDYVVNNLEQGNGLPVSREAMAAALLWLADNVSDEMSIAAVVNWQSDKCGGTLQEWLQSAISAALRAAAGSAPTTPEVK